MSEGAEKSGGESGEAEASQLELDLGVGESAGKARRRVLGVVVGVLLVAAAVAAVLLLRG